PNRSVSSSGPPATTSRTPPPPELPAPAREREQLRLSVRVRGRVDLRTEPAGTAYRLVDGDQELMGLHHRVGIEAIVLAGGAGETPGVDQRAGTEQAADEVRERLLAERARHGLLRALGVRERGLHRLRRFLEPGDQILAGCGRGRVRAVERRE